MFSSSKLVNAVAQRLLDTIEQGRWVAGQMLPGQRELAEQMEISRPSLREAIMVLETLGVVRSLPGKGVMVLERSEPLREVAAPGEATMEDVLQLRYALEPFIVGIVAQSAGAAEISELRLLLLDLREAVEDGDPQVLVEAYTAFHRRLVKLTSNPIFLSVSGTDRQRPGTRSDNLVRRQPEYAEEILQEHDAILRAIRQHDSERASQAMRQHILNEGARLNIDLRLPQV
ncbi:FadR/GntR family transcriptional regulator [Pseudomonas aeruginosa]